MNESQKAEIIVKDYAGNVINPIYYNVVIDDPTLAVVEGLPRFVIALKPGIVTLTVTHHDGRTGDLAFDITAAPLVVELGEPVAK